MAEKFLRWNELSASGSNAEGHSTHSGSFYDHANLCLVTKPSSMLPKLRLDSEQCQCQKLRVSIHPLH